MPAHVPIPAAAFARRPLAYAKTHARTYQKLFFPANIK